MSTIYLSGEVAGIDVPEFISAVQTRRLIADVRAEDPAAPVTVVLNSFGGDVTEGVAVYNLLRASRPVNIVISGIAASIASVIAMAGDRVSMYSNSTLYVHHAWTFAEGNASQMKQRTEELEAADRVLIDAYMAKSGRTEDEIVALLDGPNGDGSSISADRALELGLIDEVLDPATAVAALLKNKRSHHTRGSAALTQPKETAMPADPELDPTPSAECGGDPQKDEEVVEIEKEVEKKEEVAPAETRISELEKKVEELTAAMKAKDEALASAISKLDAQKKFRSVVASAAQTAEAAPMNFPEAVKKIGFAAACEEYPQLRADYMRAEMKKGSIR